jgi:hypothetical protein
MLATGQKAQPFPETDIRQACLVQQNWILQARYPIDCRVKCIDKLSKLCCRLLVRHIPHSLQALDCRRNLSIISKKGVDLRYFLQVLSTELTPLFRYSLVNRDRGVVRFDPNISNMRIEDMNTGVKVIIRIDWILGGGHGQ